jgi:hypothetical protein
VRAGIAGSLSAAISPAARYERIRARRDAHHRYRLRTEIDFSEWVLVGIVAFDQHASLARNDLTIQLRRECEAIVADHRTGTAGTGWNDTGRLQTWYLICGSPVCANTASRTLKGAPSWMSNASARRAGTVKG